MYERKYSLWKYDAVFRFDERERIKTRCTLEKDIMRKKNKTSTKYKLKGYDADKASAIEELKDYRSSVIRKETENGTSIETLFSYGTPIAKKHPNGKVEKLWNGWSATTGKHIKAFCGLNKREFMELPHKATPAEKAATYNGTLYR